MDSKKTQMFNRHAGTQVHFTFYQVPCIYAETGPKPFLPILMGQPACFSQIVEKTLSDYNGILGPIDRLQHFGDDQMPSCCDQKSKTMLCNLVFSLPVMNRQPAFHCILSLCPLLPTTAKQFNFLQCWFFLMSAELCTHTACAFENGAAWWRFPAFAGYFTHVEPPFHSNEKWQRREHCTHLRPGLAGSLRPGSPQWQSPYFWRDGPVIGLILHTLSE